MTFAGGKGLSETVSACLHASIKHWHYSIWKHFKHPCKHPMIWPWLFVLSVLFRIYVDHSYFVGTVYISEELHLYQRICAIQNESPKGDCTVNVTASAIPRLLAVHLRKWRNLEGGGQNLILALSELKGAMNHNSVTRDLCKAFPFLKFCCKKSPLFKFFF